MNPIIIEVAPSIPHLSVPHVSVIKLKRKITDAIILSSTYAALDFKFLLLAEVALYVFQRIEKCLFWNRKHGSGE